MSILLPISPLLNQSLGSAEAVQTAVFQLAAFETPAQVEPVVRAIHDALQPHREAIETVTGSDGETRRQELRFFDGLTATDDPAAIRLALAELTTRPGALRLLQDSPRVSGLIGQVATGMGIDTSRIRAQHIEWVAGPQGNGAPHMGPLGHINYWLSSLTAPGNWGAWAAGLGGLVTAAGFQSLPAVMASGLFLGGAIYGRAHRSAAIKRLVEAATQGPLNYETIARFFTSFKRVVPTSSPLDVPGPTDPVEAVRRSAAVGGDPKRSLLATAQVITDFLNFGSAAVEGLKQNPDSELYDRLAQAIGLGVLSRIHWQPILLNASVLDRVAEYKRQGKNVIFVGNHRSHLDILLAVALLRDFRIRFVAKASLGKVPVLKDILRLADHHLVDPGGDIQRLKKVLTWGRRMFEKGLSPFFFIEGTRMDTDGEEVGLRPPTIGAAHLASLHAETTVIVPLVSYGFGHMLRKDEGKAAREGTRLHQPTVTSFLEPIDVSTFLNEGESNLSREQEMRMNAMVWERMWLELASIQAYMNDLAVQAAAQAA